MALTLITILNWNNASDTIACIGSVMNLADVHIAVMDNHSTDNSLAEIEIFLRSAGTFKKLAAGDISVFDLQDNYTLITSLENTGFAGGNNVMLRAALNTKGIVYIWLLNNDAIATPTSLPALLRKMQEDSKTAFVGSVILDGTNTELVQCSGVKYYKWLGISKLVLKNRIWNEELKKEIASERIDFQNGASLLIRLSALKDIGPMDESYFLYYEEQDWQYTGKEKGYNNVLAADSIVYHKGSVSTNNKRHLFFYYYNKSAVIFARKHNALLVAFISTFLQAGIMLVRTKLFPKSVYWGFKGIFEGWSKRLQ